MKKIERVKNALRVIIPTSWAILYIGGGAFGFAEFAAANSSHVPPYMAILIFAWVVGFFVGYFMLEFLCKKIVRLLSDD
jgi:hypothetical protein